MAVERCLHNSISNIKPALENDQIYTRKGYCDIIVICADSRFNLQSIKRVESLMRDMNILQVNRLIWLKFDE